MEFLTAMTTEYRETVVLSIVTSVKTSTVKCYDNDNSNNNY